MNILQSIKRGFKTTDKPLLLLCLLTSLFGILMVYSATYSSLEDGGIISRTGTCHAACRACRRGDVYRHIFH